MSGANGRGRRKAQRAGIAAGLRYSSHNIDVTDLGDDDGGSGVREPRQPKPVVGPQQAQNAPDDQPAVEVALSGNSDELIPQARALSDTILR